MYGIAPNHAGNRLGDSCLVDLLSLFWLSVVHGDEWVVVWVLSGGHLAAIAVVLGGVVRVDDEGMGDKESNVEDRENGLRACTREDTAAPVRALIPFAMP